MLMVVVQINILFCLSEPCRQHWDLTGLHQKKKKVRDVYATGEQLPLSRGGSTLFCELRSGKKVILILTNPYKSK